MKYPPGFVPHTPSTAPTEEPLVETPSARKTPTAELYKYPPGHVPDVATHPTKPDPSPEEVELTPRPVTLKSVLPPSANGEPAVPGAEQPLPMAGINTLSGTSAGAPETVLLPIEDGRYVAVREPVKTVRTGDGEVELRKLSPEEKSRRRSRRTVIMWVICTVVLVAALLFFVNYQG